MSRFWNWHWKLASRDSNGQCWLSQKVQIIANWSIYCFITTSHNTSYIQGQSILLWIYQEKKKKKTISENNPNQTSRLGCWINNAFTSDPYFHFNTKGSDTSLSCRGSTAMRAIQKAYTQYKELKNFETIIIITKVLFLSGTKKWEFMGVHNKRLTDWQTALASPISVLPYGEELCEPWYT